MMSSSPESNEFQFRLRTLLLVVTSIALILAAGNWLGWRNLPWIVLVVVFLGRWTLSSFMTNHADRSQRAVQEHREQSLGWLMSPEPDDDE